MNAAEPLVTRRRYRWNRRRVGVAALRVVLPLAAFVLVVALWQAGVFHRLFNLQEYTVPKPKTILSTLHDRWSELWPAQRTTLLESIYGYVLGALAGVVVAVLVAAGRIGRRFVPGVAGAIVAVPIVALAPISVLYFGYGQSSKVAVVALLCAAVTVLNVSKGLDAVPPDPLDLMHSYAASRWQVIGKVRLPYSLPFLFVALKYNVTLALIAAIIAEFFGGYNGVGIEIVQTLANYDMPLAWAAMVLVSVVGIVWFQVVAVAERLATRWHASNRAPTVGE